MTFKTTLWMCCFGGVLFMGGCDAPSPDIVSDTHDESGETVTNRVDIPSAVRQNLGITFVEAEARRVEQTLRVPGRFEYLPNATREYRTMLPGRVEILVDQYQRVDEGALLYTIDAPGWRDLQQSISDAEASIERETSRLESFEPLRQAHHNHHTQLQRVIDARRARVRQLDELVEAGGGRLGDLSDARGALASAEADLAETLEKEAELTADEVEAKSALSAARSKRSLLLESASALSGVSLAGLVEPGGDGEAPAWRRMAQIEVRATEPGVVESLGLTNGAWTDQKIAVLTVVRPDRLRFRAVGLQSDLALLRDGLAARIVAPVPTRAHGAIDLAHHMEGTLSVGLHADPAQRTVDLLVVPETLLPWARPGVSAQLEIVTDSTSSPVLAIPSAAVQRDGLQPVFFRRDPADPNKAIRVEADLGMDDGRWVSVNSGLRLGDEVVLDGAFQLMLATANTGQAQGGHFHADGTFHAGEH